MSETMTPWQRFETAARMGIPDQVPFCPFVTGHFVSWFAGVEEGDYWQALETKLNAQLKLQERWPDLMLYPGIYIDYSVVAEPSSLGGEAVFPRNASPQIGPFLADAKPEVIEALEPPDPRKDGLMPHALETFQYLLDNCPKKWINKFGYLAGSGACIGPTDIATLSRGYESFSMDLYKRPELVHHLMDVATETCIRYLRAQEEIGGRFHRYLIADDAIGFVSPAHFVEFSLPYLQRIFNEFDYAIGILHCDTPTTHLLDVIADVGMQVFNFGPDVDAVLAKEKVGERVCLLGNINPLGALLNGTPEDVEADVKPIIEACKPGGGFILTMGSGTGRGTPSENIDAICTAVAKYGNYE